jgi:general stress protein 26
MKTDKQSTADMQHLADVLDKHRVAMFTLLEDDGTLSSRPMTALHLDAQGAVWFMASRKTWASQIGAGNEPVNLAFSSDGTHVSISGHARMDDDAARKEDLWTPAGRPWFSGPDDPDLVLLAVHPVRAEVWHGPDNAVSRAIGMAASIVAGREIGLGHKDVVTPGTAG